jgi:hypothetical protein
MARKRAVSQSPWYDELDRIVAPLDAFQKKRIRNASIDAPEQAAQLIRDWPRLSSNIWQYAFMWHQMDISKVNTPAGRRTTKKRLQASLTALNRVDRSIEHYVATWKMGRLPASHRLLSGRADGGRHFTADEFASEVKADVQDQREKIEWLFRLDTGTIRDAKKGPPIAAQTYMLEVLLAYFRHHKWDDSIKPHNFAAGADATTWQSAGTDVPTFLGILRSRYAKESRFVGVACAVLERVEGLSSDTRKFLSSRPPTHWIDYSDLDRITPSPFTKKRKQKFLALYDQ